MTTKTSDCDRERLQQLLDGLLPSVEETAVAAHIETCADCRHQLESLAADADWWQGTRDALSGSDARDDDELRPSYQIPILTERRQQRGNDDPILNPSCDADEPAVRACDADEPAVPVFLAPSDNPAMLGRLGEFEILELIGSGGMGIVLKGYDHELNRYVAVKVLHPHCATSAAARRRFAREAQAAAAIVHQHVVAIHAVDANHYPPYLVMSFVPGESLQQRLTRQGPFEVIDVLRIGQQVAEGLAAAHAQGLVHRDIKPGNILLERNVERVLLTDFGLARAADDASLTQSGVIAGTPQYMSPEQTRGEQVDYRTDLFSLGTVLYTLLAGHSPFRAETAMGVLRRVCDDETRPLREINPNVPVWLERFIQKLQAKQPSERFESASQVAELLKGCLSHIEQPASNSLPGAVQQLARQPRIGNKNSLAAIGIAIILIAAIVVLAILWNSGRNLGSSGVSKVPIEGADLPSSLSTEWDDSFRDTANGIDHSMKRLEATSDAEF